MTVFKQMNNKEKDVFPLSITYHLPSMGIWLFIPQTCHQMHESYSVLDSNQAVMHLQDQMIVMLIELGASNLPMVCDLLVSLEKKTAIVLNYKSRLAYLEHLVGLIWCIPYEAC